MPAKNQLPGQQHAIIQGMEKMGGADPAAAVHQLGLHDGDLAGGPAEADEAQLDPKVQGLAKRGRILGPDTFSMIIAFAINSFHLEILKSP